MKQGHDGAIVLVVITLLLWTVILVCGCNNVTKTRTVDRIRVVVDCEDIDIRPVVRP